MKISDRIEATMTAAIQRGQGGIAPAKLAAALEYAVTPGGARIRPTILMSVAMACGDDRPALTNAAAVALEVIHCASLVHDDLPCFDDADLRRGKPAVHRAFSEPLAVLTGDSLIIMGFQILARAAADTPGRARAVTVAERASFSRRAISPKETPSSAFNRIIRFSLGRSWSITKVRRLVISTSPSPMMYMLSPDSPSLMMRELTEKKQGLPRCIICCSYSSSRS